MSVLKSVIVVGGSGALGKHIVEALVKHTKIQVSVLARKDTIASGKTKELEKLGAKIVAGDVFDRPSLDVLKNYEAVVSTLGAGALIEGQLKLVEALQSFPAGTTKVFVPSEFGFEFYRSIPDAPFIKAKLQVNAAAEAAKLPTLHFVTGAFLNGTLDSDWWGLNFKSGNVTFYGDGESLASYTTTADIGRFVAAALNEYEAALKLPGSVVRVSGDTASLNDLVKIYEAATGKTVKVTYKPAEPLKATVQSGAHIFDKILEQLWLAVTTGHGEVKRPNDSFKYIKSVRPETIYEFFKSGK